MVARTLVRAPLVGRDRSCHARQARRGLLNRTWAEATALPPFRFSPPSARLQRGPVLRPFLLYKRPDATLLVSLQWACPKQKARSRQLLRGGLAPRAGTVALAGKPQPPGPRCGERRVFAAGRVVCCRGVLAGGPAGDMGKSRKGGAGGSGGGKRGGGDGGAAAGRSKSKKGGGGGSGDDGAAWQQERAARKQQRRRQHHAHAHGHGDGLHGGQPSHAISGAYGEHHDDSYWEELARLRLVEVTSRPNAKRVTWAEQLEDVREVSPRSSSSCSGSSDGEGGAAPRGGRDAWVKRGDDDDDDDDDSEEEGCSDDEEAGDDGDDERTGDDPGTGCGDEAEGDDSGMRNPGMSMRSTSQSEAQSEAASLPLAKFKEAAHESSAVAAAVVSAAASDEPGSSAADVSDVADDAAAGDSRRHRKEAKALTGRALKRELKKQKQRQAAASKRGQGNGSGSDEASDDGGSDGG
eukprot:361382-Chlamydomonas_euryale.AAC.13